MSLLTRKSEQQNHNKFVCPMALFGVASRDALIRVHPWNSNSPDAEWQRRLRKQLSLGKCYTLIKESATHHWKEMWIARLVFPLAFTSTDHTVIYPMERDLLWKQPFGVWLQHQRSPVLHKLAFWSFSDTLCTVLHQGLASQVHEAWDAALPLSENSEYFVYSFTTPPKM